MASAEPAIQNYTGPTNAEKIRLLPWSFARNAANTVFAQFTFFGPVFILFLSELNLSNTQIGLLLSFFPFLGVVALFMAPSVGRFGYKRTFLWFFSLRKMVTGLLLLVPWVLSRNGEQFTLFYVAAIVLIFGLCRAISETAFYPWLQEYVPNSIRGKYAAINNLVSNLVGVVAVAIASRVMESSDDLDRFMFLFAAGVVFGLISVWAGSHVPGGGSTRGTEAENVSQKDIFQTLKDNNFTRFMGGLGLVTLGTVPMFAFLPLFMEDQVGLSDGNVVLLQTGTLIGSLSATYLTGWAADRYGSKPVMLSGLWLMMVLPIGWLLIPRHSELSLAVALGIAFFQGIAAIMWGIGSFRLLFVNVVPSEKKTEYMGMYYTVMGLIGGVSQLVGGRVLDLSSGLSGEFLVFDLDPYSPLFIGGFVLLVASVTLFRWVRADTSVSVGQFAGMFVHGNPLMALESLVRYYRAKDERAAVAMTERLGQAHSPLTVDELLEALSDPRFNVRFEAIVSIARTNPDPRFVEALTNILKGTELSLTVIAAWALGRIGDTHAVDALRDGLDSDYRSIRAHCARALGTLGDKTIVPVLLDRLDDDVDKGLQMAYASALGSLKAQEATQPLLYLLRITENEGARMELALSLARIACDEQNFMRLLRQIRGETGTGASQAIFALGRRLSKYRTDDPELDHTIRACVETFAREELDEGTARLSQLIALLPEDAYPEHAWHMLNECAERMTESGAAHIEYLVLALDVLDIALKDS